MAPKLIVELLKIQLAILLNNEQTYINIPRHFVHVLSALQSNEQ